jgi:plastocyanin
MTRVIALAAALLAAALLAATGGDATTAQSSKLHAKVGPGFTISLTNDSGARVTKLDPGTYEVEVEDESEEHNFHLTGPGVDRSTGISETGKELWTVTFRDGVYTYVCDPHSGRMQGSFIVGNPPPTTPPPTTPPPATAVVTAKTKLVLTAGPEQVITLKTTAGKPVKTMKLGTYTMVVRDRGRIHDAHVVTPGFNRKTTPLTFTGTQTWKVSLRKAGTLRFLCDPHALVGMKGSAKIVP